MYAYSEDVKNPPLKNKGIKIYFRWLWPCEKLYFYITWLAILLEYTKHLTNSLLSRFSQSTHSVPESLLDMKMRQTGKQTSHAENKDSPGNSKNRADTLWKGLRDKVTRH